MGKIVSLGTYSFHWIYSHVNSIINSKEFENIFGGFGMPFAPQFHRK
jgi:hypothetical protein